MADEVRKDPKGRKLRTGETYDEKTGRYRFSGMDASGKRVQLYSWTLTRNDAVPAGKKQKGGDSLRENQIAGSQGNYKERIPDLSKAG